MERPIDEDAAMGQPGSRPASTKRGQQGIRSASPILLQHPSRTHEPVADSPAVDHVTAVLRSSFFRSRLGCASRVRVCPEERYPQTSLQQFLLREDPARFVGEDLPAARTPSSKVAGGGTHPDRVLDVVDLDFPT